MRIREWSPAEHISSVMVPVNFCLLCAAVSADMRIRLRMSGFTKVRNGTQEAHTFLYVLRFLCSFLSILLPRSHQMRGRRAGIHDPHSALLAILRKTHSLFRSAGKGDSDVRAGLTLRRTAHVVPH